MSDSEAPIPDQVKWSARWWLHFATRALLGQFQAPGWLLLLIAIIIGVPDWKSRYEFWLGVAKESGGQLSTLASVLLWPYFSPAVGLAGVVYLMVMGQAQVRALRHPLVAIAGWISVALCATAIVVTAGYGAIEFYIQQQVSTRDKVIQERAAVRPVFWHLTDVERTGLAMALDKVPQEDRFQINIRCLPDAGSRAYVEEIGKLIRDHNWKVSANCLFSPVRPDLTGLYVSISKTLAGKRIDKLPKNLRILIEILENAQIRGQFALDDLRPDEFYLVVGNAP